MSCSFTISPISFNSRVILLYRTHGYTLMLNDVPERVKLTEYWRDFFFGVRLFPSLKCEISLSFTARKDHFL